MDVGAAVLAGTCLALLLVGVSSGPAPKPSADESAASEPPAVQRMALGDGALGGGALGDGG